MAYKTASVGEVLTASDVNTYYRRGPKFSVVRSTAQTIANNTFTAITYNATDDLDDGAGHDPASNASRFVAPVAGYYFVTANIEFAASATGGRVVCFRITGAVTNLLTVEVAVNSGSLATVITACGVLPSSLTTSDYIETFVWQSSGGNLDIGGALTSRMTGFWLGA